MTPALQIPDNVKRIAGDLIDVSISRETPHMIACMVLENFAPLIVAAELRRLADELYEGPQRWPWSKAGLLRDRANELSRPVVPRD